MQAFWSGGYDATSLETLLPQLGIGLSSFYRTFGSKQALYLEAIDLYREEMAGRLRENLQVAPLRRALGTLFGAVVDEMAREEVSRGCLLVNATVERAPHDPDVRQRVREQLATNRELFRGAVARARERGEIASALPDDALALDLVNTYHGLRVTGKATADRAVLDAIVESVIARVIGR